MELQLFVTYSAFMTVLTLEPDVGTGNGALLLPAEPSLNFLFLVLLIFSFHHTGREVLAPEFWRGKFISYSTHHRSQLYYSLIFLYAILKFLLIF